MRSTRTCFLVLLFSLTSFLAHASLPPAEGPLNPEERKKILDEAEYDAWAAAHYARNQDWITPAEITTIERKSEKVRAKSQPTDRCRPVLGVASIYTDHHTASGTPFNRHALTAAHRTLPFDTSVRVTNLSNHRSVVVKVIDRGPFVRGRVIDLTPAAGKELAMDGLAKVSLDICL